MLPKCPTRIFFFFKHLFPAHVRKYTWFCQHKFYYQLHITLSRGFDKIVHGLYLNGSSALKWKRINWNYMHIKGHEITMGLNFNWSISELTINKTVKLLRNVAKDWHVSRQLTSNNYHPKGSSQNTCFHYVALPRFSTTNSIMMALNSPPQVRVSLVDERKYALKVSTRNLVEF